MTSATPPVLYISADTSGPTTRYKATPRMHPRAEAWVRLPEWQPIETAPEDGTEFLARRRYRNMRPIVAICHFAKDGRLLVSWDHDDGFNPDEWMPMPLAALPAPDEGEQKEGEG